MSSPLITSVTKSASSQRAWKDATGKRLSKKACTGDVPTITAAMPPARAVGAETAR